MGLLVLYAMQVFTLGVYYTSDASLEEVEVRFGIDQCFRRKNILYFIKFNIGIFRDKRNAQSCLPGQAGTLGGFMQP